MIRRALASAAALATVAAVSLVTPLTAHASGLDVTCLGSAGITYSPGLQTTAQTVTATGSNTYDLCLSTDDTLDSGTSGGTITGSLSCDSLLTPSTGTKIYHWDNGETSTFSYSRTATRVLAQSVITFTGTVTEGEFAGDGVIEVDTGLTPTLLQCSSEPGVTIINFEVTLEITSA
jgi:hypothetical protein